MALKIEDELLVKPLLRQVITQRSTPSMNYNVNVQLLLASMYLDQSCDSTLCIDVSLDCLH